MIATQLADTQEAFDAVAPDYDGVLGNNALVQRVRARTLAMVTRSVSPGARLLDLGCGTGLDAVALAQQGYRLTAIDWSTAMVRQTRERAGRAGVAGLVDARQLGIHELERLSSTGFDAAYSDLGALNCVPDLLSAARTLNDHLRPGGLLIASVIGRLCPWEIAIFARRREWRRATLRWSKGMVPVPLGDRTVWTRYYTASEFQSMFRTAGFSPVSLRSIGLLVPPPYALAFAERHQRLVESLQAVEDRIAAWPGMRGAGDHFLVVVRRNG